MRLNRLFISVIALLLLLLVACNNDENALDHSNEDNLNEDNKASSIFTGTSNGGEFPRTRQVEFPDNFEFNLDGFNMDERERNQAEQRQNNEQENGDLLRERQFNEENGREAEQGQTDEEKTGQPRQKQTNEKKPSQPLSTERMNDFETTVIELTNAERSKEGLPELQPDTPLSRVAELKSKDMVSKDYFSHTSPTYGSPFDMMSEFGVSYQSAGENIAYGQRTPEQVVNAWMGSAGHRENILNNDFTHIGVGFVENGNYWTQMFIKK